MRSVYFVEQKQKSPLQQQLRREKIIFKVVDSYVPNVDVRYIVAVRILNNKHTCVED